MHNAKLKLQHVLTIPFVLLITLSVLSTGYFAWRYSEQSTLDLGSQISKESTLRAQEHLQGYLAHAHSANRAVKQVLHNNFIDPADRMGLYRYMQDIVYANRKHGTLGFGYPDGAYIGSGLSESGQLQKKVASLETDRVFYTYDLEPSQQDKQPQLSVHHHNKAKQNTHVDAGVSDLSDLPAASGESAHSHAAKDHPAKAHGAIPADILPMSFTEKLVYQRPNYDARVRPWYTEAIAQQSQVWSSVYEMFSAKKLGITLSEVVYNKQGKFVGVVGTDVVFSDLDKRLHDIRLTENTLIFILDHDGHVIAQNTVRLKTDALLHKVKDSGNALLRQASDYIHGHHETEQTIHSVASFTVNGNTEDYFVNYVPYAHDQGLNWHIAVVIPESDFLSNIEKIKSNTFWIWLLSFISSLLLGILMTYLLTRSIKRLQRKVSELDYDTDKFCPESSRIKEVNDLSTAFSDMSKRLHDTFTSVKQSNELLEETISARTQELRKANNELLKLSHTDNLTQLANRRSFEELLKHHWTKLVNAEYRCIAFLMCDLDLFKEYNDYYGHQAGDVCLQDVAQLITQCIRQTDLAARYGGEEFAVVLPDATIDNAKRVAADMLEKLQQRELPHARSNVSNTVTMSIGIAIIRYDDIRDNKDISSDTIIARADKALYEAKKHGKNRFIVDTDSL